ncbi:PKD domain-containing protein, partial [Mangrovimonas futianensis]|uniref:PKD domain-containing protein n=2 Tax=Mangrovimonas futianensis TaxID=2895523 RepID=UPI001E51DFF1
MKYLFFLFSFFLISTIHSQDVLMQNGTVNQCSGVFYDSGGATSGYAVGESYVMTICPESDGQQIQLDFTEFSTQLNTVTMTIYDGPDTTANAFGSFSGGGPVNSPGTVTATPNNPSGCLTIEFDSTGGSQSVAGWAADISCLTPCQTIVSQLDSASPAPNEDGYIRVCQNEEITLTGSGDFSVDGTGATYEWDLGDGNTASGQTATFSYSEPGVYIVNLNITDSNTSVNPDGCQSTNLINQVVQVSTDPDFTGTEAADTELCFGESTTITGVVTPTDFINDCTPPVSGTTYLPDGSGAVYQTCITVDCYDSDQLLTDVNQLVSICVNMEHSYAGDLDIIITGPTGLDTHLKQYPGGGGTYLGGANDDGSNTPGVGADYCFSMSGSVILENAPTMIAGSNPPNNSYVPGTYLPEGSFNDLLGSPLNGDWCITIIDNLSVDNGYIFSWGLEFDPNLQPPELSFTPEIESESWNADSSIIDTNGNVITVQPPTEGQYCYTYTAVDDFGCEYSETVCVTVYPEIVNEEPNDLFICGQPNPPYIFDLTQNTPVILATADNPDIFEVTYHNTESDAILDTGIIDPADAYSGTDGEVIWVRIDLPGTDCFEIDSFTLNVVSEPIINPVEDMIQCDDPSNDGIADFDLETQTLGILGTQPEADFIVTYYDSFAAADSGTGSLDSPFTVTSSPQPIWVRIDLNAETACTTVSPDPLFYLIIEPFADTSFTVDPTCDGAVVTLTGEPGGTFSFGDPQPPVAVIDPTTGEVT